MTDTVYHVTTPDRAARCLEEGLLPYKTTMCRRETLELDRHYDSVRPDNITALGLTRLGSAYAHLDLENAIYRRNGGWLNRFAGKIAVLGIEIPNKSPAFVADGLFMAHPHIPEEYWASVQTLNEYMEQEKQGEPSFRAPNWSESYNLERPEKWRRYRYMWPEVLLPGGASSEALKIIPDEVIASITNDDY